ncbi:MAG: 4Fe-4S binding protein [Candidatus Omnitrophica bacterium]|nr:4Fe-4S binding protein [Candidatus Omnitrophota bacterium]
MFLKNRIQKQFKNRHWGQVVPIEDVARILEFCASITRVPCICRKTTTGKEARVCFLLSLDPAKIGMAEIVDQSFFGGPDVARFEKIDKKAAVSILKKCESDRMIHTIWTFDTPFIGGLCNCDISTGCISMKMYKEIVPLFFRAEYVMHVDVNLCAGCRECQKVCQFGAIQFNDGEKKIMIDKTRCYGCGICRPVCKKNALFLKDRRSVRETLHLWY